MSEDQKIEKFNCETLLRLKAEDYLIMYGEYSSDIAQKLLMDSPSLVYLVNLVGEDYQERGKMGGDEELHPKRKKPPTPKFFQAIKNKTNKEFNDAVLYLEKLSGKKRNQWWRVSPDTPKHLSSWEIRNNWLLSPQRFDRTMIDFALFPETWPEGARQFLLSLPADEKLFARAIQMMKNLGGLKSGDKTEEKVALSQKDVEASALARKRGLLSSSPLDFGNVQLGLSNIQLSGPAEDVEMEVDVEQQNAPNKVPEKSSL